MCVCVHAQAPSKLPGFQQQQLTAAFLGPSVDEFAEQESQAHFVGARAKWRNKRSSS